MSQTCLTLALVSIPMPCPRHGSNSVFLDP
ncbi:hypothetical protein F383_31110 [Gossypium arboreum]|uniref:Uncharacterized protein n=1 Tax=Gossypium arboreum TaxID=29729 RepID=A0A0B0MXE2_GOSAR|nr:hypothetical protein F383_31110 [Gossypium arboreum]